MVPLDTLQDFGLSDCKVETHKQTGSLKLNLQYGKQGMIACDVCRIGAMNDVQFYNRRLNACNSPVETFRVCPMEICSSKRGRCAGASARSDRLVAVGAHLMETSVSQAGIVSVAVQ